MDETDKKSSYASKAAAYANASSYDDGFSRIIRRGIDRKEFNNFFSPKLNLQKFQTGDESFKFATQSSKTENSEKPKTQKNMEDSFPGMLKQKQIEEKYKKAKNQMCYATSILNLHKLDDNLSDKIIDEYMKGDTSKDFNDSDGKVLDFPGMSKALSKANKSSNYYDYVYDPKNGWNQVIYKVKDKDSFIKSKYDYGIGVYSKNGSTGDDHYELIQKSPWKEYNPGQQKYNLKEIRPVQKLLRK